MKISKNLDEILAKPWALWVLSLVISVSMWLYVTETENPANLKRDELTLPVSYIRLAPQLAWRDSERVVTVLLEGPENTMNFLRHDDVKCELDLGNMTVGKYRPMVRVTAPPGVEVIDVRPSQIDVDLIQLVGRVFKVEVSLPQDIPAGKYLESVKIDPPEVSFRGTERDLAKIGSITVSPSLEELAKGQELSLPVRFAQSKPFEDADVILPDPRSVNVNAVLVTGQPRKKVEVDARLSGKPDDDYALRSVTMEPAEVMVQGEASALSKVSTVETETVDISGLKDNQTMVVPLRALGDGVTIADTKSVRLIIRLEPISAQRMITDLPVKLTNLDPKNTRQNREWHIDPPTVDVTVEAAPSVIIQAADAQGAASLGLNVFVDMSNIFLRKALLPVRTTVSDDRFRVVDIEPSSVTVTEVEK
ncbi:hypothetical protein FACS1894187_03130 [Synergistales bacterium]|nr:hypothetical protein FACS1894187_03130 [Synergistales bacterium]